MKNVLLIGANSAFAKAAKPFLSEKFEIITAGRKNCDLEIDVTKEFKIPENIEVVINFAANFGRDSDEDIKAALDSNVIGVFNICKACKYAKVKRLIIVSSLFAVLEPESAYYTIYAITKRHADEIAQYYCNLNNINLAVIRPSQVYGNTDDFRKNQPFFYTIMDKAQKGEDISIYGKNDALRNYIHVEDLTNILVKIIENDVQGVYETMHPNNLSYSKIAKVAQEVFAKGGSVEFLKNKADIPDNIFDYNDDLYKLINFYPKINIETGIQKIKTCRMG